MRRTWGSRRRNWEVRWMERKWGWHRQCITDKQKCGTHRKTAISKNGKALPGNRKSMDLHIQSLIILCKWRGHRGRDRMVVGFTIIYAISAYHHWCFGFDTRSRRGVQHYVINFVSDLRRVGGYLRVLRFPPPIKLTTTI